MMCQLIASMSSSHHRIRLQVWQAARELRDTCGHGIYYYAKIKKDEYNKDDYVLHSL